MKKILAALVILSLAGCAVRVMTEAEVETAVRECTAQGGTPRFVPPYGNGMQRYVKEVRCYGVQP